MTERPDGFDEFEIAKKNWVSEDRMLAAFEQLEKAHDLDPTLRENVREAFAEGDKAAQGLALAEFMEALNEAIDR